jgi:hypothetical protein
MNYKAFFLLLFYGVTGSGYLLVGLTWRLIQLDDNLPFFLWLLGLLLSSCTFIGCIIMFMNHLFQIVDNTTSVEIKERSWMRRDFPSVREIRSEICVTGKLRMLIIVFPWFSFGLRMIVACGRISRRFWDQIHCFGCFRFLIIQNRVTTGILTPLSRRTTEKAEIGERTITESG